MLLHKAFKKQNLRQVNSLLQGSPIRQRLQVQIYLHTIGPLLLGTVKNS